jgi:hypothetical protein
MTAFNAVRFKVKAGREQQFLDAHNKGAFAWPGLRHVNIIKTGEHTFCVIAEWIDMDAIVNARDRMIATLDSFRDTLEDLGGGLGVTDDTIVARLFREVRPFRIYDGPSEVHRWSIARRILRGAAPPA